MLQLLRQNWLRNAHRRNRHVERAEGRGLVFDRVEHKTPAWSESKRIAGLRLTPALLPCSTTSNTSARLRSLSPSSRLRTLA